MLKAFWIFLLDFVLLGAINSLALCPRADLAFVLQAAVCSLPLALVCASLTLIVDKWSYVVLLPLFIFLGLNVSFTWVVRHYFGDLSGEGLFVSVFMATWSEIEEFVSCYVSGKCLLIVCVCTVLIVGQIAFLLRLDNRPCLCVRSRLHVLIATLVCAMIVPAMTGDDYLIRAFCPGQGMARTNFLDVYWDLRRAGAVVAPDRYRMSDRSVTGVFVIGESASRHHWSLYGYERKTTPLLDGMAQDLMVFSNLQCTAYYTPYAMRDLLVQGDATGQLTSLPSIICSLDIDAALLSGQPRSGVYDGADELLFRQCRRRMYLEDLISSEFYDDALIPLVRTEVCVSNRQVVFVHLMGSHFDYRKRYPQTFNLFSAQQSRPCDQGLTDCVGLDLVNAYDNSIAFTDMVLNQMISVLRSSGKKAFLVYVSDHGESPASHSRDETCAALSAIPFFVWMSRSFQEAYPDRVEELSEKVSDRMVSANCMPLFLCLLGIERVE